MNKVNHETCASYEATQEVDSEVEAIWDAYS